MAREIAPRATVIVSGDDVYEDLFGAEVVLQDILTSVGFATSVGMGMGRLRDWAALGDDVVVLYTAMGEFSTEQQEALADAVAAGLGLVAIHSTTVLGGSPAAVAESYRTAFELYGSRYSSHGPLPHESRFTAHVDPTHEITADLVDFDLDHEHYRLESLGDSRTLAWRDAPYGAEPLLYVREVGNGRVCYLQLGHDMRVWDEPNIRTIIGRAADWARRDRSAA